MQDKRCTRQPIHRVREPVQRYRVGITELAGPKRSTTVMKSRSKQTLAT